VPPPIPDGFIKLKAPKIKHELDMRGFRPEECNGMKKPELLKLLEKNWERPLVWPLGKPLIVASESIGCGEADGGKHVDSRTRW
jgi:hypothetical protein